MTLRHRHRSTMALALVALTMACASAPPTLSPQAASAFQGTRAIQALDLLRDVAIASNAQHPPLIDTATTRRVVLYHRLTIQIIHALPSGWQATVDAGLVELLGNVAERDRVRLAPYVSLVRAILADGR